MAEDKEHMMEGKNMDANGWLVTFSDLIMLLLTFFVMLLAMSSMDAKMLRDIQSELQSSAGLLDYSGSRAIGSLANFVRQYQETNSRIVIDHEAIVDLLPLGQWDRAKKEEVEELIDEVVDITDDERGIIVTLPESILFDPGEAIIKRTFFPVLDSIAEAIASCPNDILIMGHTDTIPIQTDRYASNWELSSYRGLSVLSYFVKEKGLLPSRFSVGGYGPFRPLWPNDSPKNRALNRRVEIIFKHMQGA
jgi:chemotaxis protein MotB